MGKLDNRFALITGASSGIGRGVALAFAREGAHVAVNYPHEGERETSEALAEEVRALGCQAMAVQADVSSEEQVQDMVRVVEAEFGRIDILVNNAGIASMSPVHEMPTEMWDQLMSVNLRGMFLCTRAVLPGMYERDDGKIINTASQLAYKGAPAFSHYTAAKAAMITFTRSLSLEIGNRNISANCVAPGTTDTPILANVDPEVLDQIRASIPKGRIAPIEDIVPAYVFLASEDSRHFVGQTLSPNGGDVFL